MRIFAWRELVPAILVLLAFVVGASLSPYFLDGRYLLDSSSLYVETGLMALGMTLVIVCGHIDLSVAAILALVACVTAKLFEAGLPVFIVIPISLALGAGLGAFNGVLVGVVGLPSFVVTLATMAAYRGVAQVMLGAGSLALPAELVGIDFATVPGTPIPLPLVILVVFALVVGWLLHRTVLGRWVYSVGTNAKASLYSGVPVPRVVIAVFALSGIMAAIGALLMDSRLGVARFDHARGLEVDVITVVVLGGASIGGGKGSVLGTVLALLLVALIRIGLGVANVTADYQLAAVGTLLVVAVLAGNVFERRRVSVVG